MKPIELVQYRGRIYRLAKATLPASYSKEAVEKVDAAVSAAVLSLVSALEPQKVPAKDFGRALAYAIEGFFNKLKSDPAVSQVEKNGLPKELR
jgi:hypothetical protein